MSAMPNFRFVEAHNISAGRAAMEPQPHAYVCDTVLRIDLECPVSQIVNGGVPPETMRAIGTLRDGIADGAEVGWYVVICDDEVRDFTPEPDVEGLQLGDGVQAAQGLGERGVNGSASPMAGRWSVDSVVCDSRICIIRRQMAPF